MKTDNGFLEDALLKSAVKINEADPSTPDFQFFKSMVEEQQAMMLRSQKRQLLLFTAVAAVLVSALILFTGRFEAFFIALQGAAATGAITGVAVFIMRNRTTKAGAR